MARGHVTVTTTLRRRTPPWVRRLERIKRAVLGTRYVLSLVLIGDSRSETLNRTYRGRSHPANVLSFPLVDDEGEIFLNLPLAEREAKRFGVTPRAHATRLFIHGVLHLKGMRHGATMDAEEERLSQAFS